jgi:hypothetical protein
MTIICTKIEIDLMNPENTTYTFGEAPRALSDNVVQTQEEVSEVTGGGRGGGRSVKKETGDIIRWAYARAQEEEALYSILTGEVRDQGHRLSKAEITLDGVNAQIVLKADVEVTDELGRRVSAAEIEIDGLNSEITLKADKVTIDAELTTIKKYLAGEAIVAKMNTGNLTAMTFETGSLKVGGHGISLNTLTYVKSVSGNATGEIAVRGADGSIVGTALTGYRVTYSTGDINILTY